LNNKTNQQLVLVWSLIIISLSKALQVNLFFNLLGSYTGEKNDSHIFTTEEPKRSKWYGGSSCSYYSLYANERQQNNCHYHHQIIYFSISFPLYNIVAVTIIIVAIISFSINTKEDFTERKNSIS